MLHRQCCTDVQTVFYSVVRLLYRRCCIDVVQTVLCRCTDGVVQMLHRQCCTDVQTVFYSVVRQCCTDVQTVLYGQCCTMLYRQCCKTALYRQFCTGSVVQTVLYRQCCTWHLWKQPPLHLLGRHINHQFCIPCAVVLPEEPDVTNRKFTMSLGATTGCQ